MYLCPLRQSLIKMGWKKRYENWDNDSGEGKAGYNQSAHITEILGNLLGAYILHMNNGQFDKAVSSIERVHDIISAKIKSEESDEVDKMVAGVIDQIPTAMQTFVYNGQRYVKDPYTRKQTENKIKKLFRHVNNLQDKYGYGMIEQDDPRLAVLE